MIKTALLRDSLRKLAAAYNPGVGTRDFRIKYSNRSPMVDVPYSAAYPGTTTATPFKTHAEYVKGTSILPGILTAFLTTGRPTEK